MCDPSTTSLSRSSSSSSSSSSTSLEATTTLASACHAAATTTMRVGGGSWKRNLLWGTAGFLLFVTITFGILYCTSMPFRRTVTFWKGMAPIYLEYKYLKVFRKPRLDAAQYETELDAYYHRAANQLVTLILKLGGIATKIGQVLATVGQGILPDPVVTALRVLQDGVPAKSYPEIARIVEQSHGNRPMDDMFTWFSPEPLGAASIAQAHLARLAPNNETVVVKVQYPEIRRQLHADLRNLRWAVLLLSPENTDLAATVQQRHERELDFRLEAQHLRECRSNLQAHGVEPNLVRIPRVYNQTGLCSENILVMEYLEGTSLARVVQDEQARLARAMGFQSSNELQSHLTKQLKTIGGAQQQQEQQEPESGALQEGNDGSSNNQQTANRPKRRRDWWTNPTVQTALQKTAPVWTRLFRAYAGIRDRLESGLSRNNHNNNEETSSRAPRVNLARALKTLVHVHGLQMLLDGTYNADPHGGNVLVMPDGRLGLLDYGMIGRFSERDRYYAVETILALADGKVEETAQIYTEGGYKANVLNDRIHDPNILHRFATFHFDRIDLTPVRWASTGESQDVLELLASGVVEPSVPKWVEDGRRLGALMMGPHIQSGRVAFSLARSWKGIARRAQAEFRKNPDWNQTGVLN
eukprot:CAMPEP_0168819122 /NCGR_PEP_ID=MMETSP0726-20121227/8122_1 /TAXON_ID=265536 /ORGANISM="Amphiprora sp., Strain CCMP467" /LENGTH=640 /DNA_ID=CAMNT_0008871495 /DNA_START=178 /DNA_END=2100 /DNA_ORIENTATION=-